MAKEKPQIDDFINLKEAIKNELKNRRKYSPDLSGKAKDFSKNPTKKGKILAEHQNIIVDQIREITTTNVDERATAKKNKILSLNNLETIINGLKAYPIYNNRQSGYCTNSTCAGLCFNTCGNTCDDSCTGTCSGSCTGDCKGGCGGSCSNTCSGSCSNNCSGCGGCDSTCTSSCGGKRCGSCSGTCTNSCAPDNCTNSCIVVCKTTCTGSGPYTKENN